MENLDDMNRKDNEIRHILQGPLGDGDHSWAEPGDHVWAGIQAALPGKKKRGGLWWWFGGAFFILLLAVFLIPEKYPLSSKTTSEAAPHKFHSSDQHIGLNPGFPSKENGISSGDVMDQPVSEPGQSGVNNAPVNLEETNLLMEQRGQINSIKKSGHSGKVSKGSPMNLQQGIPVESESQENQSDVEPALRADHTLPAQVRPVYVVHQIPGKLEEVVFQQPHDLIFHHGTNPVVASTPLPGNSRANGEHRLVVYGHGIYGDRRIERKSTVNIFDPEFGHKNTQFRFGAGYEYQHKSGVFAGTGIEYQEFHERVEKEKKWIYTKQNSTQVGSDLYQQNIPVVINSGFGTASATLRVDMEENSMSTNYKEGDPVIFKMTVDHSLNYMRIPLYLGYQYQWRRWFGEFRGGTGLQVYLGSNAQVTQVTESRGKIKIRESETVNQLKHVRPTIWDLQGGLYVGYKLSASWGVSCGYEYWQSLQSVVDRPNMSTYTSGSGMQIALRRSF